MSTMGHKTGPAALESKLPKRKLSLTQKLELATRWRKGESSSSLSKAFEISIRQVNRTVENENGESLVKRSASKHVTFRAPEHEIEAFLESARSVGITGSSQAFRALVRMSQGMFELFPDQMDDFRTTKTLLQRLGQNLNQITKKVHKGKLRLTDAELETFNATKRVVFDLEATFKQILEEAESRRGYSLKALKKAKEQGRG